MKTSTILLLVFTGLSFLLSCSKHKNDITDHVPVATLSILKPAEAAVFNVGDSVTIEGAGISSETIHGYDVVIKKANDTTTYYSVHIHDHNDTLHINHKWKAAIGSGTSLEAVVTLELDHDGHTLTRRAGFIVK